MNPTYTAYIDESGDEGFSFDEGSSSWSVISAVVIKKHLELNTVKLLDEVRVLMRYAFLLGKKRENHFILEI